MLAFPLIRCSHVRSLSLSGQKVMDVGLSQPNDWSALVTSVGTSEFFLLFLFLLDPSNDKPALSESQGEYGCKAET